MKNKKYKVEISKEKVVIKPTPGHEIDVLLLDKINMHYEHDGIFKPIKKELPKTWEEYLRNSNKCYLPINHLMVPLQYNEAFEALGQLIELRDHYNDGWVPDWNDDHIKETIRLKGGCITTSYEINASSVLAFKNEKLRDEFFSNFRELINAAKSLL